MKSTNEALRKRGLANSLDISLAKKLSVEQLYEKLLSFLPVDRSAAAFALQHKECDENERTIRLLDALKIENTLYPKLAICKSLESGNSTTALLMCNYLGKIGNNQLQAVPPRTSWKKSYPLPRDIIARTLGKMNKSIFGLLLAQAEDMPQEQLIEILDAIGYMAFYNNEVGTSKNFATILRLYYKYKNNELIVWKLIMCCSGFHIKESIEFLNEVKSDNTTIQAEIRRSLRAVNV
ncbi:hypothetical protein [Bacteroides sp. 519]|uniref:hypothetical protein n=1 Tax=Bacteroides sp. 519 TaxID=2302937 RepID=UPI0013D6B4BB|nr:hypothetical protein [Bacteroides sp. 519]NDV60434.1 hypothetical protein [Bacteroides sp. 519]